MYDDLIPELRDVVRKQLETTPSITSEIYEQDVEQVKKSDKLLRRFLEYFAGDTTTACDKMILSFKLQKELMLREMKDDYFPHELWILGSQRLCGKDKDGRPVAYLRLKYLRSEKIIREIVKRFIAYHFWKLEVASQETEGAILIVDFAHLPFSHFNLDICLFALSLKEIFPLLLKQLIVLNVPWFAKAFCNTMKFAFPAHVRDLIIFLTVEDLRLFINESQIPAFLNGSSGETFEGEKAVPAGAPDIVHFAIHSMSMSEKEAQQLLQLANLMKRQFLGDEN